MTVVGATAIFALGEGFFLWLVGIVFGSEGNRPPMLVEAAGEKKCPQRAGMVKRDARVCRLCRFEFKSVGA